MKSLLSIILLTGVLFGAPLHFGANEKLAEQRIAAEILTKVYARAGLDITVEEFPAARVTILCESGDIDGEAARIKSYGVKHPTLIRVDPPYYTLTATAFVRNGSTVIINTTKDLKGLRVGIIRGVQHSLDATKGVVNLTVGDNAEQLFRMLEADRLDAVLDTKANGNFLIKRLNIPAHEGAHLAQLKLFNYLHPKNRAIAQTVTTTLQKLIDSGELATITTLAEHHFLESE